MSGGATQWVPRRGGTGGRPFPRLIILQKYIDESEREEAWGSPGVTRGEEFPRFQRQRVLDQPGMLRDHCSGTYNRRDYGIGPR